jgi:uncharacterized protein (TIGR00255 family)
MTGYGHFSGQDKSLSQTWEIKSVNGKQFSVRWRLPQFLSQMEQDWERLVRKFAERGRIEIYLSLQLFDSHSLAPRLDQTMAQGLLSQLEGLARSRGQSFSPDLDQLLSLPSLWTEPDQGPSPGVLSSLQHGLDKALLAWDQGRRREGQALGRDVASRLDKIQGVAQDIVGRASVLPEQRLGLLKQRVEALLKDQSLSQDRFYQELALLTDRLDVSEELTRLKTHLHELQRRLGLDAPNGRHLDFLLQECLREINTCGNKCQDSEVSQLVVEIKTELEKCREQAQNIE